MIKSRRSMRLKDHDYTQGGYYYFITICTQNRAEQFGRVENDNMVLNQSGKVVREEWVLSEEIRQEIELDEFIIMPNHLHGIIMMKHLKAKEANENPVTNPVRAHGRAPQQSCRPQQRWRNPKSLGSFIAGFKSITTKRINELRKSPRKSLWQANYYDHIIRTEISLHQIRQYILDNPINWPNDPDNNQLEANYASLSRL